MLYLTEVVLCGVAIAACSKQIAIFGGLLGCVCLFFFLREYLDLLHYLKLKRELDAFYQAGP